MFKITIEIPNLTEKAEKFLDKKFAKLEKIFEKPRESLFEEALIRYMEYMEWDVRKHEVGENTKKDPDEWRKEEIKRGKKFDKIMKKIWNREQWNSYIVEALFEYLEDMEDLKTVEKIEWKDKKGKKRYKKQWDMK